MRKLLFVVSKECDVVVFKIIKSSNYDLYLRAEHFLMSVQWQALGAVVHSGNVPFLDHGIHKDLKGTHATVWLSGIAWSMMRLINSHMALWNQLPFSFARVWDYSLILSFDSRWMGTRIFVTLRQSDSRQIILFCAQGRCDVSNWSPVFFLWLVKIQITIREKRRSRSRPRCVPLHSLGYCLLSA